MGLLQKALRNLNSQGIEFAPRRSLPTTDIRSPGRMRNHINSEADVFVQPFALELSRITIEDTLAYHDRPAAWRDSVQCVRGVDPFVIVEGPDVVARVAEPVSENHDEEECSTVEQDDTKPDYLCVHCHEKESSRPTARLNRPAQEQQAGVANEELHLQNWETDGGFREGSVVSTNDSIELELRNTQTTSNAVDVTRSEISLPSEKLDSDDWGGDTEEKVTGQSTDNGPNLDTCGNLELTSPPSACYELADFDASDKPVNQIGESSMRDSKSDFAGARTPESTEFELAVRSRLDDGEVKDAFKRLVDSINKSLPPKDSQVLTFVTSDRDEDYLSTVARLACQLVESQDGKVLLVDGNSGPHSLSNLLKAERALGMADVLDHGSDLNDAIQTRFDGKVDFLPAGCGLSNQVDFPRLASQVVQWRRIYRYVLIVGGEHIGSRTESLMEASEASYLLLRLGTTSLHHARRTLRRIHPILKERLGCIAASDRGASRCVDFS